MSKEKHKLDPKLDLYFERIVNVPRELIWQAWTNPQHLKKWFCPLPWTTVECEIDLRAGGIFSSVMQSPEGHQFPNQGCYLEVIENEYQLQYSCNKLNLIISFLRRLKHVSRGGSTNSLDNAIC